MTCRESKSGVVGSTIQPPIDWMRQTNLKIRLQRFGFCDEKEISKMSYIFWLLLCSLQNKTAIDWLKFKSATRFLENPPQLTGKTIAFMTRSVKDGRQITNANYEFMLIYLETSRINIADLVIDSRDFRNSRGSKTTFEWRPSHAAGAFLTEFFWLNAKIDDVRFISR